MRLCPTTRGTVNGVPFLFRDRRTPASRDRRAQRNGVFPCGRGLRLAAVLPTVASRFAGRDIRLVSPTPANIQVEELPTSSSIHSIGRPAQVRRPRAAARNHPYRRRPASGSRRA
jgi:hypothetical protein